MTLCYYCVCIIAAGGRINYTYNVPITGAVNGSVTTLPLFDTLLDVLNGVITIVAGTLVMTNPANGERVFVQAECSVDGTVACRTHIVKVMDN